MGKNPYENARFERFIGDYGMTALFVIDEESPTQYKTTARVIAKRPTKIRISKITM